MQYIKYNYQEDDRESHPGEEPRQINRIDSLMTICLESISKAQSRLRELKARRLQLLMEKFCSRIFEAVKYGTVYCVCWEHSRFNFHWRRVKVERLSDKVSILGYEYTSDNLITDPCMLEDHEVSEVDIPSTNSIKEQLLVLGAIEDGEDNVIVDDAILNPCFTDTCVEESNYASSAEPVNIKCSMEAVVYRLNRVRS